MLSGVAAPVPRFCGGGGGGGGGKGGGGGGGCWRWTEGGRPWWTPASAW